MRWKRKSFSILVLSLLIALLVWCQMGMYLTHLFFGVDVQVNFFKFCVSLFKEESIYYFFVVVLLNAIIAYTFLVTLFKTAEQLWLSVKFKKKILSALHHDLTRDINARYPGRDQTLMIIHQSQPLAFTMGLHKPCIILSTGLIEMLDEDELEAVIEHETFHQKNLDPFKIFVLKLISQALWFIPLTKWSYHNYKIMSELMADEFAIHRTGSELGLSSALFKLIKNACRRETNVTLVHFSQESVNYRLQQLVEPQKNIPLRLETAAIVVSVQVLLLLLVMVMVAVT
ncbi:M56 family metallopeptidase [Paenibacillus sp. FJAT-26967]|uniref:M56 family metallopeptidase n=1 Tax=Paenibacillus sp. FJAT-26967 TaxID=1729690 RepID=UPI000839385F|nr:M56 family metallopeptidase [Paenibacillus sp. FJAT-26967]